MNQLINQLYFIFSLHFCYISVQFISIISDSFYSFLIFLLFLLFLLQSIKIMSSYLIYDSFYISAYLQFFHYLLSPSTLTPMKGNPNPSKNNNKKPLQIPPQNSRSISNSSRHSSFDHHDPRSSNVSKSSVDSKSSQNSWSSKQSATSLNSKSTNKSIGSKALIGKKEQVGSKPSNLQKKQTPSQSSNSNSLKRPYTPNAILRPKKTKFENKKSLKMIIIDKNQKNISQQLKKSNQDTIIQNPYIEEDQYESENSEHLEPIQKDDDNVADYQLLRKNNPDIYYLTKQLKTARKDSKIAEHKLYKKQKGFNENGEEYVEMMMSQLEKIQKLDSIMKIVDIQAERINQMKQQIRDKTNPVKVQEIAKFKYQKLCFFYEIFETMYKMKKQSKEEYQRKKHLAYMKAKKLKDQRQLKLKILKQAQQQQRVLKQALQQRKKDLQEKTRIVLYEQFQVAIANMLCTDDIFYRYGARYINGNYTPKDYISGLATKWEADVEEIDIIDLKVYMLALMTPCTKSIFERFEYDSNVYKVLFGMMKGLSSDDIKMSIGNIWNTIQKSMLEQKYDSMNSAVNNGKRKRIVIVGERQQFEWVMKGLICQMKNLQTQLIAVSDIQLSSSRQKYYSTCFEIRHLHLKYIFEKNAIQTTFQIFTCELQKLNMVDLTLMRKKSLPNDSMFFVIVYPKLVGSERIEELMEIHRVLEKCQEGSFSLMGQQQQGKRRDGVMGKR